MKMKNLKEYIDGQKKSTSGSLLFPLTEVIAGRIINSAHLKLLSISDCEKKDFGEAVAKIAFSDEVISDLSKSLGVPKENETEDEFVARGKNLLRSILKSKLKIP
jgi:hypothetical protein